QLWKDAGEPPGLDHDFWKEAERSLAVQAPELDAEAPLVQPPTAGSRGGGLAFVVNRYPFLDGDAQLKSYLQRRRQTWNSNARKYCRQKLIYWHRAVFIAAGDRKTCAQEFCLAMARQRKDLAILEAFFI